LFRPEDPNQLIQVLPQREVYSSVERIKGFRYPAPGSRMDAKIPVRESEDAIYDTNYYSRDPRNLPNDVRNCDIFSSFSYLENILEQSIVELHRTSLVGFRHSKIPNHHQEKDHLITL
jgi:hypothetical protein